MPTIIHRHERGERVGAGVASSTVRGSIELVSRPGQCVGWSAPAGRVLPLPDRHTSPARGCGPVRIAPAGQSAISCGQTTWNRSKHTSISSEKSTPSVAQARR